VVQCSIDAWFDLLPGMLPGKFHLSGENKLSNANSVDKENLNLNAIKVCSNTEFIYSFEPYFIPKSKKDDYSLKSDRTEFIFGTKAGLKIDSRLEANNVCEVTLNFEFDEGNFIYQVDDVEIIRTY